MPLERRSPQMTSASGSFCTAASVTTPIPANNAQMPRYVALLRGINIGPRNRISMPELRAALEEAGFGDVQTYLQSGNVVLESRARPETVRREIEGVIAERFGLEIAVVVRTKDELAAVVRRNPHRRDATDPKLYQVTFLSKKLPAKVMQELEEVAVP